LVRFAAEELLQLSHIYFIPISFMNFSKLHNNTRLVAIRIMPSQQTVARRQICMETREQWDENKKKHSWLQNVAVRWKQEERDG
jgi:hypothetical protein